MEINPSDSNVAKPQKYAEVLNKLDQCQKRLAAVNPLRETLNPIKEGVKVISEFADNLRKLRAPEQIPPEAFKAVELCLDSLSGTLTFLEKAWDDLSYGNRGSMPPENWKITNQTI